MKSFQGNNKIKLLALIKLIEIHHFVTMYQQAKVLKEILASDSLNVHSSMKQLCETNFNFVGLIL